MAKHRTASGYQPPPMGDRQVEANVCRVCGQLGQGHQYHESWECAAILAAVHPQLRADDDLITAARLYYTQAPCFWNRALLPWAWTEGLILQRAMPTSNWVWGQIPMQVPAEETWMAATDGSGGEDNRDSRFARVGWGVLFPRQRTYSPC